MKKLSAEALTTLGWFNSELTLVLLHVALTGRLTKEALADGKLVHELVHMRDFIAPHADGWLLRPAGRRQIAEISLMLAHVTATVMTRR